MAIHPPNPILLVDDEATALTSFDTALRTAGMNNTVRCQDGRQACDIVAGREVEAVLLDLMMPHVNGEDVLERIARDFPEVPVIVATGEGDVDTAVRCMQKGAFDYLLKPVDRERLAAAMSRAVQMRALRRENASLAQRIFSDRLENPEAFAHIVTRSRAMRAIFQYCEAVASGHEPVLVTGETGTGKELVAQALHALSGRRGGFVAVNVAGVDDTVFSDTLFGHAKGAFTGADRPRSGLIEKAAAGTLFLDEIGDLSETSQVKLLRVLQEREYTPLGSDLAKPTDARVIAATQCDPARLTGPGGMRKDLYFRLSTHHVRLPPLRERREDVQLLLEHFLEAAAGEFGRSRPTCPPELAVLLGAYSFPGNVRELRGMVYDALGRHKGGVLSMEAFRERIAADRAAESVRAAQDAGQEGNWAVDMDRLPTLKEADRALVREAMRRSGDNLRIAAGMLGITHQALSKRLKRSDD